MPMAVPGDPEENERVLKRMAEGMAAYKRSRPPKRLKAKEPVEAVRLRATRRRDRRRSDSEVMRAKNEYEKERLRNNPLARAKKRLSTMIRDYRRYQWAIKWELALPRHVAKVMAERG